MKIYKCDKCKTDCYQPKDWYHHDDPLALEIDLCPRCTTILIMKGLQKEKQDETTKLQG